MSELGKLFAPAVPVEDKAVFDNMADEKRTTPTDESFATKQAAMSAVMGNADLIGDFKRVKSDLMNRGVSEDVENFKRITQEELTAEDAAVVQNIIGDDSLNIEDKAGMLRNLNTEIEGRNVPALKRVFLRDQSQNAIVNTRGENKTHESIINNINTIEEANQEIESIKAAFAKDFKTDVASVGTDFVASVLAPGFGIKIAQIVADVLPEKSSAFHNIGAGEALTEWKTVFRNAEPADRVAMAKKLLPVVREYASIGFQNDFESWDIMETFLGDVDPSESAVQFDRWLINVVGVLDLIPIVGGIGTLTKHIVKKVAKGSVANDMATSAPVNASGYLTGAVKSLDNEVAASLGTTKDEILNTWAMPKSMLDEVPAGPDINANIASRNLDQDVGIDGHAINYTPFEKYKAADRELTAIEEVEASTFRELLSKTRVETIPGGFNVRTVLGQSEDYGFATVDDAMDGVADVLLELPDAKVTVLRRDYDVGSFVEEDLATARAHGQGEFYVQLENKHIYNPEDTIGEELDNVVVGATGSIAKFLDKSSVFARWIGQAGNVAALQTSLNAKNLTRVMQPFNKLSAVNQAKVLSILDEGGSHVDDATGKVGKWFDQDELSGRFDGDDGLIKAYNSVKVHQDLIYDAQNKQLLTDLTRAGMKSVLNTKTGWERIAKPLSLDEALAETHVLDPLTENIRVMDDVAVRELYDEGGSLARMAGDEMVDNELTNVLLVSEKNSTNIGNLPENVLNKRDGYITTIYDTTHIVKKKITGVRRNGELVQPTAGSLFNGRPLLPGEVLVPSRMASNSGEAARAARRMNQNADDSAEYGSVEARELHDSDYANQGSYDFYRDKGQLYFSKRGAEVQGLDGRRPLTSVIESIEAARLSSSRHIGMDDFVNSQTGRWEKKFADSFGIGETGSKRMPLSGSLPLRINATLEEKALHRDATALRDHIAMVSGIDSTVMRQYGRRLKIFVAEKLAGAGQGRFIRAREAAATALLRNRDRNVLDGIKGLAFLSYIVLNPARQLILQSQQATVMLGLDHGFKYFASGKGIRDFEGLTLGIAAIDNPKLWKLVAPSAAKGMEMSIKEYTTFIRAFRQTGIPDDIDSHSFINMLSLDTRSAVSENALIRGGKHLSNGAKNVARLARTVGFDAGEYVNLSASFLAVRNKWIKNNPKKNWLDDDNLAVIAGETREVSFNMNRAGTLAWQKGLPGVMFQFMSHASKSMQVLIPNTKLLGLGKLSNKAFNNKERLRIALSQAAIYGTAGYGLNNAWHNFRDSLGIELPEQVNNAVDEGIAGTALSMLFHSVDPRGEQTSLSFSQSFGPFSGGPKQTPVAKVLPEIIDALLMNQPNWNQITPAGFGALQSIVEATKFSALVLGSSIEVPEATDLSTSKAGILFNEVLSLAPAYNNWLKGKAAQKTGAFATRSGDPTIRASAGEILAKQLFGIRSTKEVAVQNEIFRLLGREADLVESPDTVLQEIGTTLHKRLLKFTRLLNEGEFDMATYQNLLTQEHTMLKFSLDETEYNRVMEVAQEKIFSQFTEGGEVLLSSLLTKYLSKGSLGNLEGRASVAIKNMPEFEGKSEVLKWVDNMLETQSALKQQEGSEQ